MKKSENKRKAIQKKVTPKKPNTISIIIGKEKFTFPKEELEIHNGVHKIVVNKVLPWVEKVLNGKV